MGVGLPEVAKVVIVEGVSVIHVLGSDVFLLCLGHGCLLVHTSAELVSPVSLGSNSQKQVSVSKIRNTQGHRQHQNNKSLQLTSFSF